MQVTQLYRGDLWLRGFDQDVRTHLKTEYDRQGIDVRFKTNVTRLDKNADGSLTATLTDGPQAAHRGARLREGRREAGRRWRGGRVRGV